MSYPREHEHRIELVRKLVDSLYERFDETVNAVVADGWPEPMVRAGFTLHRRTWDVNMLHRALEQELSGFGGARALRTFSSAGHTMSSPRRLYAPKKMIHVWPALPGAGLTPVLFGWLIGAQQIVRPSSRGVYFAELLHRRTQELMHLKDTEFELLFGAPDDRWRHAEAIVASGSDETIAALQHFLAHPGHRGNPTLLGYGHRVSFGVIVDEHTDVTFEQAEAMAQDIVMWHQMGCFSARAVIFCGTHARSVAFMQRLGDAIALCEQRLGATKLDDTLLAQRAQARGLAELMGHIYGEGVGWAQPSNTPWTGDTVSPHTVTVHTISDVAELHQMIRVPAKNLQGAALFAPKAARRTWCEALASLGVTRICAPGMLQAPSPSWLHDGHPNMLDLLRVSHCELDI